MRRMVFGLLVACAFMVPAGFASADVCNVKVVTDASPDYTDIGSMLHSITDYWQTPKDKCFAIWYWNQVSRRQTAPMQLHGMELTDPIRQFNDYGYTMCSTIAGTNCSIWGALGYNVKFWDITAHTVPEVFYDGYWHMYDSSLSALYTTCDGSRLASVTEIGQDGACAASGGKTEPGHIAKYHCLCSTSPNGFLIGCDTIRGLSEEAKCFTPKWLKYRFYFNNWDLGHRYILNLRDGEVYTRYYHRTDADSPNKVVQNEKHANYLADPAYFVPNEHGGEGKDPEGANPRYRLRGNGLRTWTPPLTADGLSKTAYSMTGVRASNPSGVVPAAAGAPGEVIFKVEGSNVIASVTVKAALLRRNTVDVATVSVSTNNGLTWKEVYKADKTGEIPAEIKLLQDVNGSYEVLVKVSLMGKFDALDAQLSKISFDTITMLNSKTQPKLNLGKNTIYVGAGDPTESVVIWPDLEGDKIKKYAVDEQGLKSADTHPRWHAVLCPSESGKEGYVTFRIDTPGDMTKLTYGGRFYNIGQKSQAAMLYSFDDGKTWTKGYSLTDTSSPWDVIHYEKVDAPAGKRSALVKYTLTTGMATDKTMVMGIYALRIEANYKPVDSSFKPMEVTYVWNEVQKDYSTVKRSHTQLVDKVPFTYAIDVGGEDHPVMELLSVNVKGAAGDQKYGYSDGKDVGGQKIPMRWIAWGKNLSVGKPYTASVPSETDHGAGDKAGTKLTDGVVGPPVSGGTAFASCAVYKTGSSPVITLDLGAPTACGAFCIDIGGYPAQDAIKGLVKDKVELFVSLDDKDYKSLGFYDFNLRWKDVPANIPFNDDETFCAHNFPFVPPQPVTARYVRWVLTPSRMMTVSEVQVWDSVKLDPWDIKIALPDDKDRSDITQYNPKHYPSKEAKVADTGAGKEEGAGGEGDGKAKAKKGKGKDKGGE